MAIIKAAALRPSFYILDPDLDFLQSLSEAGRMPHAANEDDPAHAIPLDTALEAFRRFPLQNAKAIGFFINPAIGQPDWIRLVKLLHTHHPSKPIFLLLDHPMDSEINSKYLGVTDHSLKELGILATVQKPTDLNALSELLVRSNPEKAASVAVSSPSLSFPASIDTHDDQFLPLDRKNLMAGIQTTFSIYIKLGLHHYVKVARRGDVLTEEQFLRYVHDSAGQTLYILKIDLERYIHFCDEITDRMLNDPGLPLAPKIQRVLEQGTEVLSFFTTLGVTKENLGFATRYVNQTRTVVQQLRQNRQDIEGTIKDLRLFDHAISVCFLGSLMLLEIGVASEFIHNSIGVALFLHDISLFGKPESLYQEDETIMSSQERAIYLGHPEESARILRSLNELPEAALEAVSQHHMRLNGTGFPERPLTGQVNRIGELIGICDDFIRVLKQSGLHSAHVKVSDMEPQSLKYALEVMRHRSLPGFSAPLRKAFENTFRES